MQLIAWIQTARPKTLPLAIAGPLSALAGVQIQQSINWLSASLVILTILLLQIIANFANDLGDGERGADQARVGPTRAIASGLLSPAQIKHAIKVLLVLTGLSGLAALATSASPYAWWLVVFGALSMWAALAYTLGNRPYGYRALGDLSVAIFYGPVAVFGTWVLQATAWQPLIWVLALAHAAWAALVLHINNMRDADSDRQHQKITLAVHLGALGSKIWYVALIIVAALSSAWASYYFLPTVLPFAVLFTAIIIAERTLNAKQAALNKWLAVHALLSALASMSWLTMSLLRF